MIESLQYLDYTTDMFVKESMLVMYFSKGGLDYKSLRDMPFDTFEKFVDESVRIQNENQNNNGKLRRGDDG